MRGWRLLFCVALLGCSVADPELLEKSVSASGGDSGGGGAPGSGGGATTGGTTTGGTTTGGTTTGGTATGGTATGGIASGGDDGCGQASCVWQTTDDNGCDRNTLPSESQRPPKAVPDELGSTEGPAIYLALTRVWLGETSIEPGAAPVGPGSDGGALGFNDAGILDDTDENAPWKTFGFDLDGTCTASPTCAASGGDPGSCRPTGLVLPLDGNNCIDNAFARLQPVAAAVPELGGVFGITETAINCSLYSGTYNQLIKLSGYNGTTNDDHVRVDVYASLGLESPSQVRCPDPDFRSSGYQEWLPDLPWLIDERSLATPMSGQSGLSDSIYGSDGFVVDGYLVAELPEGYELRLPGDRADFPGWISRFRKSFLVGKLEKQVDTTWRITEGMLAGVQHRDDLILSFRNIGMCPGGAYDATYNAIATYLMQGSDTLSDLAVDLEQECDSLSAGMRFQAKSATPGALRSSRPVVDCCLPENETNASCPIQCGDGRRTGGELCDVSIAEGEPDACPTSCPAGDACSRYKLVGSGCATSCELTTVTKPIAGDGCCPAGQNSQNDSDCTADCGNGVVEAGETCDPPGSCPTVQSCVSGDACTRAVSSGSASACNVACTLSDVTTCTSDDGCCPAGCSYANDRDCPEPGVICGDGRVGNGEYCDRLIAPGRQGACPSSCPNSDGDSCTIERLVGTTSQCTAHCTTTDVTMCANGDGCCLSPQCNANNDSDCSSICGNRIIEPGEACDDGNTADLDGCVDCKIETPYQQCITLAPNTGAPAACQECVCRNCTDISVACGNSGSQVENDECNEVVACGLRYKCTDQYCYCGLNPICLPPIGRCSSVIEAAAHTTNVGLVLNRQDDLSYPLGRAKAVGACSVEKCATECGF